MIVQLPSLAEAMRPVGKIKAVVASSYGISLADMDGPSRKRAVAWPRQMAMYLARRLTNKTLSEIGLCFGRRDHTTVMHAIRAVEARMAWDQHYQADFNALRAALTVANDDTAQEMVG